VEGTLIDGRDWGSSNNWGGGSANQELWVGLGFWLSGGNGEEGEEGNLEWVTQLIPNNPGWSMFAGLTNLNMLIDFLC
jgi:hypothetical protein